MLQAGLFSNFKGADSLLIWGDPEGVTDLRVALSALARGVKSTLRINGVDDDLWIKVSDADVRSELKRSPGGLEWICSCATMDETEALVTGLEIASSGHQYIAISGLARQVIVSKAEYPAELRASMGTEDRVAQVEPVASTEDNAVFLLWHSHDLGNGETDDKLIGVYTSETEANAARIRKLQFEGFRDFPEGFLIEKYELNHDYWSEGYFTT